MLTLDLLRGIHLQPTPYAQMITATLLLMPNYNWPLNPTKITVEGIENIPKSGRVILALNHTDRYNYWPLQYTLWRRAQMFTATWVKGKYYNSPMVAKFITSTNNIPTPSRGYLITSDVLKTLGEPPGNELYRLLRDAIDQQQGNLDALVERAEGAGLARDFEKIISTPRDILGRRFDPSRETYTEAMSDLFRLMMDEFIRLNQQAFDLGHKIIVFPEGTRSLRLTKGRPGLAQMALRMNATVVPVGCNGSDDLYPGNSPVSQGGHVVYRIGEPLTPEEDLAPFQIEEDYTPFTPDAEARFGETFEAMTELLMSRIAELLDERYLPSAGETTEVTGAERFM